MSFGTVHYGVEDGLPEGQVPSMVQDADGTLWIATLGGLVRFDGRTFESWRRDDRVPDAAVWSLLIAQDGELYVGAASGVYRRDGDAMIRLPGPRDSVNELAEGGDAVFALIVGSVYRVAPEGLAPVPNIPRDVRHIAADATGAVWTAGPNGLVRVAGDSVASIPLGDLRVNAMIADGSGLWVGGPTGLYHSDGHGPLEPRGPSVLRGDVSALGREADGTVWANAAEALVGLRGDHEQVYAADAGFGPTHTWCSLRDREGNLWVGSNGDGRGRHSVDRHRRAGPVEARHRRRGHARRRRSLVRRRRDPAAGRGVGDGHPGDRPGR